MQTQDNTINIESLVLKWAFEVGSVNVIIKNMIFYRDHVVVCDPSVYSEEYMTDMIDELTPDGDKRTHAAELRAMNNDGSWGIKKFRLLGD